MKKDKEIKRNGKLLSPQEKDSLSDPSESDVGCKFIIFSSSKVILFTDDLRINSGRDQDTPDLSSIPRKDYNLNNQGKQARDTSSKKNPGYFIGQEGGTQPERLGQSPIPSNSGVSRGMLNTHS